MAKVNFGGIVTEARGKLGTVVYSKNRYAAYAKNKTIPRNPKTTAQLHVRSIFSAAAKAWSASLTAGQRAQWNDYAQLVHRSNVLGEPLRYTGFAAFVQSYFNLTYSSNPTATVPPSFPRLQILTEFAITSAAVGAQFITYTNQPTTGSLATLWIRFTPPLTAGRTWIKNRLRNAYITDTLDPTAQNPYPTYTALFGTPAAGDHNVASCYLTDRLTGQRTIEILSPFTWTA